MEEPADSECTRPPGGMLNDGRIDESNAGWEWLSSRRRLWVPAPAAPLRVRTQRRRREPPDFKELQEAIARDPRSH